MDKDFHYYGAYTAARLAGYKKSEAVLIAHASQYVDDAVEDRIPQAKIQVNNKRIEYRPRPTIQTNMEMGVNNFVGEEKLFRRIWVPFHFLPGNYQSRIHKEFASSSGIIQYTGDRTWGVWPGEYKYGARQDWELKLICQANSPLVEVMINDITENHEGAPYLLHLTGLRMHVLADTWSHMFYAGTPSWWINEAGDVYDLTEGGRKKIEWGPGAELCTPAAASFQSAAYLGHARMGHVPDYPWLKYECRPHWSREPVIKDNPADFLTAFKQMVAALKCIKEGKKFHVQDIEAVIGQKTSENISDLIKYKGGDWGTDFEQRLKKRCKKWQEGIKSGRIGAGELPEEYDSGVWFRQARENGNYNESDHVYQNGAELEKTDYFQFHKAAEIHFEFVQEELEKEGIPFLDVPE